MECPHCRSFYSFKNCFCFEVCNHIDWRCYNCQEVSIPMKGSRDILTNERYRVVRTELNLNNGTLTSVGTRLIRDLIELRCDRLIIKLVGFSYFQYPGVIKYIEDKKFRNKMIDCCLRDLDEDTRNTIKDFWA